MLPPENGLSVKARDLYQTIRHLPIVSPHGHCDPRWWAEDSHFPDPASLLIKPDHYVFRMLYSRGIDLADLGIGAEGAGRDPRDVFRIFADNWHLFLGTASRRWLDYSFRVVFGIDIPLSADTSDVFFDQISACLASDEFRPRALFDRFGIEVLSTTDGALDDLEYHREIAQNSWAGRILPTFRPDSVLNPSHPDFGRDVVSLGAVTGEDTETFKGFCRALRKRRRHFIDAGATATDHDVPSLQTEWLDDTEAQKLLSLGLEGKASAAEALRFYSHMLIEMAQMSVDDGMIMQLHVGATRSTNTELLERFGPNMGADIPRPINWVDGLGPLLNRIGNNPDLTLIVFTLDETSLARELAPMAGHWPALKLGPPWWFHDSENGIERFFDNVVESAGYWNLAGFNDDTRAFTSIPARHDLWRRGVARHLGRQVEMGRFGETDAIHIAKLLTHDLAYDTYNFRGN